MGPALMSWRGFLVPEITSGRVVLGHEITSWRQLMARDRYYVDQLAARALTTKEESAVEWCWLHQLNKARWNDGRGKLYSACENDNCKLEHALTLTNEELGLMRGALAIRRIEAREKNGEGKDKARLDNTGTTDWGDGTADDSKADGRRPPCTRWRRRRRI